MKFVPMYDLERLSEEQRQEYYLAACEYMQVPPELNVLAFHWMDHGDGARNLVLYAKKGATDIIRKNLGISVIDLKKEVGNGEVTWVAKGQNKEGRTEMSSGSKSVEGLRGRELESAVMWAQTKALRRMTLQFVGGGILDETEIAEPSTVNISHAPNLAKIAAQPTIQPSAEPGKEVEKKKETPTFDKPFILTPIPDAPASIKPGQQIQCMPSGPGWTMFNDPDPDQGLGSLIMGAGSDWGEPSGPTDWAAFEVASKAGVELARQAGQQLAKIYEKALMPDSAQKKAYKERLRGYSDEVLPKAGMMPNEHGGIGMRLRVFATKRAGVKELTELSIEQWENLFTYFEAQIKEHGVAELIRIIDATV